jgi:hypothetical protein
LQQFEGMVILGSAQLRVPLSGAPYDWQGNRWRPIRPQVTMTSAWFEPTRMDFQVQAATVARWLAASDVPVVVYELEFMLKEMFQNK